MPLFQSGPVKTTSAPYAPDVVLADLTAVNNVLVADVSKASNIVLHVKNTGGTSMAAGAFAFEASLDSTDGADGTWFPIQVVRSNANTVEGATGTLTLAAGAGLGYAWEASVNAYNWVRVRCTTLVTAGAIATWRLQRGTYATEPIPAIQAHAVTQSGTWTMALPTGAVSSITTVAGTNLSAPATAAVSLFEITIWNPNAATAYLKLYNKASNPTLASDIPFVIIPIEAGPKTQLINFGGIGKRFTTGISVAVVSGVADTDATNAPAGIRISLTRV